MSPTPSDSPFSSDLQPTAAAEVHKTPATAERWREEAKEWVRQKQAGRKYIGRPGEDAVRFLSHVGEWLVELGVPVTPDKFGPEHVWKILPRMGRRGTSRRYYCLTLSTFLSAAPRRNFAITDSEVLKHKMCDRTPRPRRVLSGMERDMVLDRAVGVARLVVALLFAGRRRIELERCRVIDLHLDVRPPYMDTRDKGGDDAVVGIAPISERLKKELDWYLPLRASRAEKATSDDGYLFAWLDGDRLRGYSPASFDRLVGEAVATSGIKFSSHVGRHTAAHLLLERGGKPSDVQSVLHHKNFSTTDVYLRDLTSPQRAAEVAALLDRRAVD
jgi:integrase